ncbi:MAG: hypothetical protein U0574_10025 [Phycisphaerales bacterium]
MAAATRIVLAGSFASLAMVTMAAGQNLKERLAAVAQERAEQQAVASGKPRLLGALLYTDISVDFKKQTTRECFEYLKTVLGVPMVVRYTNDKDAKAGIDPDAPVELNVRGPALTVLENLLQQVEMNGSPCTWQLRDGFIEVGTKERLMANKEVRIYPVMDLLYEVPYFNNAPNFSLNQGIQQGGGSGGGGGGFGGGGGGGGFGGGGSGGGGGGGGVPITDPGEAPVARPLSERADDLISLITESVEPEAWVQTGGECTIRFYNDSLIVKAPDYVHRKLAGYPFNASRGPASESGGPRYVTFTAPISVIQNTKFTTAQTQGAAGGGGGTGGTGSPSGGGSGGKPGAPAGGKP